MTELPKEWQQEADRIAANNYEWDINGREDFKQGIAVGATAYKQAVEKSLKHRHSVLLEAKANTDLPTYITSMLIIQATEIEMLLTELQTLTPTSND
jgi:hypothetical protein